MSNKFRYNWNDCKNNQFLYDNEIIKFKEYSNEKKNVASSILFILNVNRERWVVDQDILDFIWADVNPDNWSDWQLSSFYVALHNLRKLLPEGIEIVNRYGGLYSLQIEE